MSSKSGYSPSWKRPTGVLKVRKKKAASATNKDISATDSSNKNETTQKEKKQQKRKNPFGCSPRKRANLRGLTDIVNGEEKKSTSGDGLDLFDCLDNAVPQEAEPHSEGYDRMVKKTQAASSPSKVIKQPVPSSHTKEDTHDDTEEPILWQDIVPADWSLKSKCRYMSLKPFSWCGPLRSADEAAGICAFVRCQHQQVTQSVQEPESSSMSKVELERHCMTWAHPVIPTSAVFPRIVEDGKIGKTQSLLLAENVQNALQTAWTESFTSAFQLTKVGMCPYFYLCTHMFTVLFRAGGIGGRSGIHAVLTPTSRGFRQALTAEGIEFKMPLYSDRRRRSDEGAVEDTNSIYTEDLSELKEICDLAKKKPKSENPEMSDEDQGEEDGEDIGGTDEGAHSWLESMGLDKKQFPSLVPNRVKLQRESYKLIDNRPESTVFVEGADTQAMFNYLLNCRSCTPTTGTQAGLPPTILAPVAYKGASLYPLKVRQGTLRQKKSDESYETGFTIEVSGPLLPCTIDGLNQLFSHTQGTYSASYSTQEHTTPFNVISSEEDWDSSLDSVENYKGAVQDSHLSNIIQGCSLGRACVRDLQCENGSYNVMS